MDEIKQFFIDDKSIRKPDFVAGDWNNVEDKIDRLPAKHESAKVADALDEMKESLQLVDGWGHTFPDKRMYSYAHANNGSRSRIDRIYVKSSVFDFCPIDAIYASRFAYSSSMFFTADWNHFRLLDVEFCSRC